MDDLALCPRCDEYMQAAGLTGNFYCQNCGKWFPPCKDCGDPVDDERFNRCGRCR